MRQRRACFLLEQRYYEVHEYIEPDSHPETSDPTTILHVQTQKGQNTELPPFIEVLDEISDNPKFSAQFLSTIRLEEEGEDEED